MIAISPLMLIDTHCHLDFKDFDSDRNVVIESALEAGVQRIINIGTTPLSSQAGLDLGETHEPLFATVGIHPCYVDEFNDQEMAVALDQIRELADHPLNLAIGECGLDYHHLPEGASQEELNVWKERQKHCFRSQLDLAAEKALNVVVHQRKSWDDCIEILAAYTGKLKTVFHCFGEAPERAKQLLEMGHYVSFTGIATFKNAKDLHETIRVVPAGSYMVETDAPYLSPVPFRGKRCEPARVVHTAERIAELRETSVEDVISQTHQCAMNFFRWPSP